MQINRGKVSFLNFGDFLEVFDDWQKAIQIKARRDAGLGEVPGRPGGVGGSPSTEGSKQPGETGAGSGQTPPNRGVPGRLPPRKG